MRIGLYHARAATKNAGGKAVFVRQIARALAADHDVHLYTEFRDQTDVVDSLRQSDVTLFHIPPSEHEYLRRFLNRCTPLETEEALSLISGIEAGLVSHVNDTVDVLLTHKYLDDLILSNLVDVPTIYQFHNVASAGSGAWAREYCSSTNVHLANSQQISQEVRAKLNRSVDGIVSPGLWTNEFTPSATPKFDTEEPAIMFVGRLREGKGIFDLVTAVSQLSTDVRLYVVGDGEDEAIRELANQHGIGDTVTILGEVPHAELPEYYAACDVFCNPTHYEGFGMVNLEAMACGVPVVTSDLPAIREYAAHEKNALLVSPRDVGDLKTALERLITSPALQDELGSAGQRTASHYSWELQAEQLSQFCSEVIDETGERASNGAQSAVVPNRREHTTGDVDVPEKHTTD